VAAVQPTKKRPAVAGSQAVKRRSPRQPSPTSATDPSPKQAAYPRSTGSSRGEARRQALLELVTDDLVTNGLVDFSLRRAARAAGTTHKVLLYHFDGPVDLLTQAVFRLRDRRITKGMAALGHLDGESLGGRVRAIWPVLSEQAETDVLDQAIGLAMYDQRYAGLGQESSAQYLPSLVALLPANWTDRRKTEVSEMIFATFRGLLLDRRTGSTPTGVQAGLDALVRAVEREEAAAD
jgi:AcrR family transcriptional regulator